MAAHPALRYDDGQFGLAVRADGNVFDLAHGQHAVDNLRQVTGWVRATEPNRAMRARSGRGAPRLAEDDVLVVQPVAGVARDEKLAAVRAGAGVGHR